MVLLQLCFAPGSFRGSEFARIVRDSELGFEPRTVTASHLSSEVRFDEKALDRIAAADDLRHARVIGNEDEYLLLGGIAGRDLQQIIWRGPAAPPESLVKTLTREGEFNAGHLGDAEDIFWQSETSIATYKLESRRHDHLPKRPGGIFPGESEEIDVGRNPGRAAPGDGFWLCAAPVMWFGRGSFGVLDRTRLESTPAGKVHREGPDLLRVDLFPIEWYRESRIEAIRERQAAFREWMRYDEIETKLVGGASG
jgi:hypothetical protein